MKINKLCDYGCNNLAKFKFKNGKYCCENYSSKCSNMKKINSQNGKNKHKHNYIKIKNNLNVYCSFGCGKIANYLTGQRELKPCCSKYYSQCINVRNKNSESLKNKEYKKGKDCKLFGRKRPEYSKLMKEKNPMFDKIIKQKWLNKIKSEEYRNKMSDIVKKRWTDEYKEKYSKILLEKGLKHSDEELGKLKSYYRKVYKYTKKSILEFSNIINPDNKPIGIGDEFFHIDHIFSIMDGFRNNIDPEIIGSYINLQTIPSKMNILKKDNSWISLNELIKNYQVIKNENNI